MGVGGGIEFGALWKGGEHQVKRVHLGGKAK